MAGISNLRSFGMFLLASSIFSIGISFSSIATSAYVADIAKKNGSVSRRKIYRHSWT